MVAAQDCFSTCYVIIYIVCDRQVWDRMVMGDQPAGFHTTSLAFISCYEEQAWRPCLSCSLASETGVKPRVVLRHH
jgi:hypothetical protein